MKIFIICSVRIATEEYRTKLETYVSELEQHGHIVHLPHRDTDQGALDINICKQNMSAIKEADEIHIFYNSASTGTHFDLGMAFAFEKHIVIVENEKVIGESKSFPRMLEEWESYQ